jgi:ubiquinone/menaquinone biosynthesis C-methylase UbiE
MNWLHGWLCRSDRWRETVRQRVPWALAGADLGPDALELGPGFGLTTDLLHKLVSQLTTLEIDPALSNELKERFAGTNVAIVNGDASSMPFPDARFSGAVSFTMLHHVPSPALQDKVLREVCRVLKPGAIFAGSDSLQSWRMRLIHIGDTLVPVNPDTFAGRLQSAGFEALAVEKSSEAFRFLARRPTLAA